MSQEAVVAVLTAIILAAIGLGLKWPHATYGCWGRRVDVGTTPIRQLAPARPEVRVGAMTAMDLAAFMVAPVLLFASGFLTLYIARRWG